MQGRASTVAAMGRGGVAAETGAPRRHCRMSRAAASMLGAVMVVAACGAGGHKTATPSPTSTAVEGRSAASTPGRPSAWRGRTPAPTARQEVARTVLDGRVWVLGGLTPSGVTDTVDVYDPLADRWAPGPALPVALHHAAAVTYRGEVVVVGGFLGGADLYGRPSDRVLALRGGAWVDLPNLRRPRGAAAAAVVADLLVVVGGRESGGLVAPTEVFDGTRWQDRSAPPVLRDHLAAVSDGQALYAVGGRLLAPGRTSGAFERYDPSDDQWQALPALPTARGGLDAALVGTRLVVVGGEDASRTFGEAEAFDLTSGSWSTLRPLPTPRHGLAVAVVGSELFALAGGTRPGVAPSAVAEALSP